MERMRDAGLEAKNYEFYFQIASFVWLENHYHIISNQSNQQKQKNSTSLTVNASYAGFAVASSVTDAPHRLHIRTYEFVTGYDEIFYNNFQTYSYDAGNCRQYLGRDIKHNKFLTLSICHPLPRFMSLSNDADGRGRGL